MATSKANFWKQLWQWTTLGNLNEADLLSIIGTKEVLECLRLGISSYKPLKNNSYSELQTKYPDQTKLLSVVPILQNYIDVDTFQTWDIIKHYLCDISYGTPSIALKNVAFVDTRPSFLLPSIWKFYHAERLFLLKLLLYIVEFKDDPDHKYREQFKKIISDIGIKELKSSLLSQFESLLSSGPPPRRIEKDFSSETTRQEWAEFNLREQLTILQILILITKQSSMTDSEFRKLFELFRKHKFGKNQTFNELLEERHREFCMRIMYMEISLFIVTVEANKMSDCDVSRWLDNTKSVVESELTKLQINDEHSAMLIAWMLLTLRSEGHAKLFESHYQHFGTTALKLSVFEFLHQMLNSSVLNDNSECSLVVRQSVFAMLNELCDKFDGGGSLSHQKGIMQLAAHLLQTPEIAERFWFLHYQEENIGLVSLWNTALEYFPYNFSALSTLAAGLAKAGANSVRNLLTEFKNLPVYTEVYKPNLVPVAKISADSNEVFVGKDYFPLTNETYRIDAGSRAAVMEGRESTLIHFRTPYSYWTIFVNVIEKALGHQHQNLNVTLQRVYEGTKVLAEVLKVLVAEGEVPKAMIWPCEGVFDVLVRFMRAESPPLLLLMACLRVCEALVPLFHKEIHLRLINTGLLPRLLRPRLTAAEYAGGASLDPGAVGAYLVTMEQPTGSYGFLTAYLDMLCTFCQSSQDERVTSEIVLPGLVFALREVLPNVAGWRYTAGGDRRELIRRCVELLFNTLQPPRQQGEPATLVQATCVYGLLHTENALELLKVVAVGNDQLERMMYDESNWVSGPGARHLKTIQRAFSVLMLVLRLKTKTADSNEMTPMEHLIFAQNKQKDDLKVVPSVTSYINHAFNKNLSILCCRLLNRFATEFQMSLFSCLDMTAYQVRVMFLDRLQDKNESMELKIAILEFVAACVGKQPGLTEAFFNMRHPIVRNDKGVESKKDGEAENGDEGILMYMAEYLGTVKNDVALLHSPLLGCIMALFHALWKNNMQILVKELREGPNFWEQLTSPLFSAIQPGLRSYAQIFNVLGIELFVARDKIDPNLKVMLENFFDTNKNHLDNWLDFIYSFKGKMDEDEAIDRVPVWLGLLTSWKDFTTIFCKCLPFSLNIAHKAKLVTPCLAALLNELEDFKDGRLVVILAELYVIMLSNWKEDCFDNRKLIAKQMANVLTNTAKVYECLHPRAKRAILAMGTVAISSLDYEIKANSTVAQTIIRAVTDINSFELERLFDYIKEGPKPEASLNGHSINEDIAPIDLSLTMLEQCLDLYDAMFTGLDQWFQSTMFINKLLCCLQSCLQNRKHYHTSLAALRCLIAYSRGPFSKDLLLSDIDQFLWMQLLTPKFDANASVSWKPTEWWKVYSYSLDFISMMVMRHGEMFADDCVTFVGVHLEHLVEAILLPGQVVSVDSLNLCASALNVVVQLVKYETRWRVENNNSWGVIMRSISTCLCHCVMLALRARRPSESGAPTAPGTPAHSATAGHVTPSMLDDSTSTGITTQPHTSTMLNRILELVHMSALCLLAWSPPLLTLLAEPVPPERWRPLVELHFGAPKISYETVSSPQLSFGTLLAAVCLLTKSLYHTYHADEGSGSRSPRGRRRACSCGLGGAGAGAGAGGSSPGEGRRAARSESFTSLSSGTSGAAGNWLGALKERLVAGALDATLTLLASQALLVVRDPQIPSRHKQLVRRELSSELTVFHDFVRKRVLCAAHARPPLVRNKLGAWPLERDDEEMRRLEFASTDTRSTDDRSLPPPPPPLKRPAQDSMREYILRKHYLDKCAQTPIKEPPLPVSHSTPTSDKKVARSSKRVSWAETTHSDDELDSTPPDADPPYSSLTEVNVNNDEDYFHFMSVVFLYICQSEL